MWHIENERVKDLKKKGSKWKKEERRIKVGRVEMFNKYRADG